MGKKFILDQEDRTIAGGNNRGDFAVDLQMERTAITQVASGNYSFIAGANNTATGGVALGIGNTSSGSGGVALGDGNNTTGGLATGTRSTAAIFASSFGYQSNASAAHSFVQGPNASASGNGSTAIGNSSNAQGGDSFALASSTAIGLKSFAQGNGSRSSTDNSSTFGSGAFTSLTNQQALGNNIVYIGDSQTSKVVYSINTGLVASGGTYTFAGAQLIIPKNNTYTSNVGQGYICTAKFIYGATQKAGTVNTINNGDFFTSIYNFAAKSQFSIGGSLIGSPTLQSSFSDSNLTLTVISITIGTSGEILFTFTPPTWTGGGTIQFRGTLSLEFTELGIPY
jgi:hypothetical protein